MEYEYNRKLFDRMSIKRFTLSAVNETVCSERSMYISVRNANHEIKHD